MDKPPKMSLVEQWEYLIEKRKEIENYLSQGVEEKHPEIRKNNDLANKDKQCF